MKKKVSKEEGIQEEFRGYVRDTGEQNPKREMRKREEQGDFQVTGTHNSGFKDKFYSRTLK